eukprot:jgi/Chlat1/2335/Chrsp17S02612
MLLVLQQQLARCSKLQLQLQPQLHRQYQKHFIHDRLRRCSLSVGQRSKYSTGRAVTLAGGDSSMASDAGQARGYRLGKLTAGPVDGPKEHAAPGEHRLNLDGSRRDGIIFVPRGYEPWKPTPLMLCLHGAGGNSSHRIDPIKPEAERDTVLLVAIDSVSSTWDVLRGGFGPDVSRIDQALQRTFRQFNICPRRVAIEGFSDGASYALSLGLTNGNLFKYIYAFSPGFMRPPALEGRPRLFVSHGSYDPVLPVACSHRIVRDLSSLGYEVTYKEFKGGHTVPQPMLRAALDILKEDKKDADLPEVEE